MARLRGLRRVQPQRLRSSRSDVPPGSVEYGERPQETGMEIPAPVKGWNHRDPYAAMDDLHAVKLINMYPTTGDVQARRGCRRWDGGNPSGGNLTAVGTTGASGRRSIQHIEPLNTINLSFNQGVFAFLDDGRALHIQHEGTDATTRSLISTSNAKGIWLRSMWEGELSIEQCRYHTAWIQNEAGDRWFVCAGGNYGLRMRIIAGLTGLSSDFTDYELEEADLWLDENDRLFDFIRRKHRTYDLHAQADQAWGPRASWGWSGVIEFKNRLFWWRNDVNALFYGDLFAPGGELHSFTVQIPGRIAALGRLTRDGGDGPDDYLVILSNLGMGVIYQGTDPSHINTWSLVGNFWVGRPLGYRPFLQFGADLLVMTTTGIVPLSAAVRSRQLSDRDSVSQIIRGALEETGRDYPDSRLWDSVIAPDGEKMIFNVPGETEEGTRQFVMNTLTKAWCEFRGWPATCWASTPDALLYGTSDGKIFQADVGHMDVDRRLDGRTGLTTEAKPIHVEVQQAYNKFRTPREKHFNFIEPQVTMHRDQVVDAGIIPDLNLDPVTKRTDVQITPLWPDGGDWLGETGGRLIFGQVLGQHSGVILDLPTARSLPSEPPNGVAYQVSGFGTLRDWEQQPARWEALNPTYFNPDAGSGNPIQDDFVQDYGFAENGYLQFITHNVNTENTTREGLSLSFGLTSAGNLLVSGDNNSVTVRLVTQPPFIWQPLDPDGGQSDFFIGRRTNGDLGGFVGAYSTYLHRHFRDNGLLNVLNTATTTERYPRLLLYGYPASLSSDEINNGGHVWVSDKPQDDIRLQFVRQDADVVDEAYRSNFAHFEIPTHVGIAAAEGLRTFEWELFIPEDMKLSDLFIAFPRIAALDVVGADPLLSAHAYPVSLHSLEIERTVTQEWSLFNKLQTTPRLDALGTEYSEWDTAVWDRSLWDRDFVTAQKVKVMCGTKGRTGSIYMEGDMQNAPFQWSQTMVGFSTGRV